MAIQNTKELSLMEMDEIIHKSRRIGGKLASIAKQLINEDETLRQAINKAPFVVYANIIVGLIAEIGTTAQEFIMLLESAKWSAMLDFIDAWARKVARQIVIDELLAWNYAGH